MKLQVDLTRAANVSSLVELQIVVNRQRALSLICEGTPEDFNQYCQELQKCLGCMLFCNASLCTHDCIGFCPACLILVFQLTRIALTSHPYSVPSVPGLAANAFCVVEQCRVLRPPPDGGSLRSTGSAKLLSRFWT